MCRRGGDDDDDARPYEVGGFERLRVHFTDCLVGKTSACLLPFALSAPLIFFLHTINLTTFASFATHSFCWRSSINAVGCRAL